METYPTPPRRHSPTPAYPVAAAAGRLPDQFDRAHVDGDRMLVGQPDDGPWPSTFERVLYAAAATVVTLTCLIVLWVIYEAVLFIDRVGDALQQLGNGLQGIGG